MQYVASYLLDERFLMAQCDSCRAKTSSAPTTTVTERKICTACNQSLLADMARMVAAGPQASTSEQMRSAVATRGFLKSLPRR